MIIFELKTDYIELYKLLKVTGVCDSGAQAKEMITSGQVKVNGEKETRKGNKIKPGQKITCGEITIEVKKAGDNKREFC